jgi:hypothetical protein
MKIAFDVLKRSPLHGKIEIQAKCFPFVAVPGRDANQRLLLHGKHPARAPDKSLPNIVE